MTHTELITEKMTAVCQTILQNSRNELYLQMRYLDLALSALRPFVTTDLQGIGTDGRILAVHPHILADLYEQNRLLVNRVYLHTVMHCLLRHLFKQPPTDDLLWDISCDIACESIIDSMQARCVRTGISRVRKNWYDELHHSMKVLTAEGICHTLRRRGLTPFELQSLRDAFCIDDHSLWPLRTPGGMPAQNAPGAPSDGGRESEQSANDMPFPDGQHPDSQDKKTDKTGENRDRAVLLDRETLQKYLPDAQDLQKLAQGWQDIAEKTQTHMETFAKDAAEGAGTLLDEIRTENRQRYDYRTFLRRFAMLREEMQVDPDTFDYVFYTYGLSLYGNMPLIEPQEYKDVRKIQDFVIVIDVSMSTSGPLVKTFLEQTFEILTEQDLYTRKVHIRILQCDDRIREDTLLTDMNDLQSYAEHFVLKGGGGTDFRPAFAYVQQLVQQKAFTDLRGMIYFTDGRGTYPKRPAPWDTAFVFMEEDYTDVQVPPWAMKLIIEKKDLEDPQAAGELRTDYRFL